jgi:tripartite-type tricarboxylate transporter receptor subunit TctC
LGHPDPVYSPPRSIVAAPDIPEAARAGYTDLMREVDASDRWKRYTAYAGAFRDWLDGEALAPHFVGEVAKHRHDGEM